MTLFACSNSASFDECEEPPRFPLLSVAIVTAYNIEVLLADDGTSFCRMLVDI